MSNLVQLIASCFLNSLWEVAVVGGMAWIVGRPSKRLGPGIQHLLWVTTLGLAVVTPAMPLLRSILAFSVFSTAAQNHPFTTSVFDQQPMSNGFVLPPVSILALFLFFLGALIWSAARLGWSLRCTIRLRREAYPVSLGPEAEELWEHCTQAFSVKEARVLRSEAVAGPVTIGFAHPALLVSDRFIEECASHDVFAALAHECAHIKRRDFQKNLFYQIASLPIAFHPVTWFVKSQIARTREIICDDMATERLIDRRSYAESLLRLAKMISLSGEPTTSNAIGIFDANALEERIMTMKAQKKQFGRGLKWGLGIGSIVVLLCVGTGIGSLARPIEAQSQGGSSTSKSHVPVDLSCTYYDSQDRGFDGTCETHKEDRTHYFCAANFDRKLSQEQMGCQSKIERARSQKAQGSQK
jgi:beta-lactamase regulating signal transducer with metallopeptidase domain